MLALLSLIFGGLLRLAPDIVHLFTAKEDHAHEIAMTTLQQAGIEKEYALRMQEQQQAGTMALQGTELSDMLEAIKAQGTMTGVKWVDAMSATVRPFLTYWWMILYTAYKFCVVFLAYHDNGGSWTMSIHDSWTMEDMNILSGIIGFWFVDRVRRYQTGK